MITQHHNIAPDLGGLGAQIPGGIVDKNAEIFALTDGSIWGTHNGKVTPLAKMKPFVLLRLTRTFRFEMEAQNMLREYFKCATYKAEIQQWIKCNFGGFDVEPDFESGKSPVREYWNCGRRGNCICEGVVCKPTCITANKLTRTEAEVIKWIAEGLIAKEIANKMNITVDTAHTHERNIRNKLKVNFRAEISKFAYKNHITF
ncbi:MAG: hypothetical protein A2X13_14550 [Bacteroidetes bacterium GWC2_33_15]|nr:MAG: hypothetical protein A2X10_12595 [Bacteroidetes bacterium GWA2_33_15]OFX50092.1 MAG: hypothetical protein A2X13_14550 [Bacteroidetes bacterium GWC2_33_15]OFX65245.1 MAG: hypothetical protein A2X15_04125 [Bacteroidetes bacterium GWB2_32_14]OFX70471.1 MAG: hypothetical protein A2X14_04180 [Bacteroidetes bacterium GWD2_33_33]HAN19656.1 hypothetical protein [Bacteroidales bacterium]